MFDKKNETDSLEQQLDKVFKKIKINAKDLGIYVNNGECKLLYLDAKNLDNITCYQIDNAKKLDIIVKDKFNKEYATVVNGKEVPVESLNNLFYQDSERRSDGNGRDTYMRFKQHCSISKDIYTPRLASVLLDLTSYFYDLDVDSRWNLYFQTVKTDENKSFSIEKLLKSQEKINDIYKKKVLKEVKKSKKNEENKQNEQNENDGPSM